MKSQYWLVNIGKWGVDLMSESQRICPGCSTANEPTAGFCGSCGASLGTGTGPTYAPPQQPTASGYQPPAYQPPGYQQNGYQQTGYQQTGYQQTGYQQPGYTAGPGAYGAQPQYGGQVYGVLVPAGYAPAGFWIRFLAYLIDGLVLGVVGWLLLFFGGYGLGTGATAAYFVVFWALKGQTPGKMALGLYVVSSDGQPLSWGKAVIRYIGYIVSAVIFCIGFIMIGFDDAKRGLHDRIAGTLVVRRIGQGF